jgi:hypothetical protein
VIGIDRYPLAALLAERAPELTHGDGQNGLAHRFAAPDDSEQLVFRNDPGVLGNEMLQKLEHAGLDSQLALATPQHVARSIELEFVEGVDHSSTKANGLAGEHVETAM